MGIGSDPDGDYGTEQTPADLDTIADLRKLPELLERRGYRAADIQGIVSGDWLRFFGEVLPEWGGLAAGVPDIPILHIVNAGGPGRAVGRATRRASFGV